MFHFSTNEHEHDYDQPKLSPKFVYFIKNLEHKDFVYMTDVMPAADQKMRELFEERYFATPKKMGAQTAEANINAGIAAARQIVDFFVNGVTKFQVNK